MPIPFRRCNIHGLTKHYPTYTCAVCADENRCTQPTDVQQLKAEIAAVLDEFDNMSIEGSVAFDYVAIMGKLRQLSAV